jgi:hypothetical protein
MNEAMQAIAASLDEVLNGDAKGKDRKVGFVLLTFPFGELGTERLNRVNYIGNGERSDVYAALKELIARWDGNIPARCDSRQQGD